MASPRETLASVSTPQLVETRAGALHFRDGAPSRETVGKIYDRLDFVHVADGHIRQFWAGPAAEWRFKGASPGRQ